MAVLFYDTVPVALLRVLRVLRRCRAGGLDQGPDPAAVPAGEATTSSSPFERAPKVEPTHKLQFIFYLAGNRPRTRVVSTGGHVSGPRSGPVAVVFVRPQPSILDAGRCSILDADLTAFQLSALSEQAARSSGR